MLTLSALQQRRADVCACRREEHIATCGSPNRGHIHAGGFITSRPWSWLSAPPPSTSSLLSLFCLIPNSLPVPPPSLLPNTSSPLRLIILFPHRNSAHICLFYRVPLSRVPQSPPPRKTFSRPATPLCGWKPPLFESLIQGWATTVSAIESELFWMWKGIKIVSSCTVSSSAQEVRWLRNTSFAFKRCVFPTKKLFRF